MRNAVIAIFCRSDVLSPRRNGLLRLQGGIFRDDLSCEAISASNLDTTFLKQIAVSYVKQRYWKKKNELKKRIDEPRVDRHTAVLESVVWRCIKFVRLTTENVCLCTSQHWFRRSHNGGRVCAIVRRKARDTRAIREKMN